MAALLGIENSLQQKKQKVDYTNMLDMFKVLDAIPEEQEDLYETFWTGDAVEKVVDIQSMDRLFGVQRERKDYLGNIIKEDRTKQEDNGKNKTVTHYIYEDIVACEMEASKYFRKDLKEKQKSRCMNIDFATKLSNLNIDDYRELFDMPSSKNLNLFQNLKDQILKAKKELADKKIVLIRKDIYKVNSNINLIDDVLENNCAFHTCNSDADLALSGERVVEKLQHSGRPANYREDKLSKWLKENEAGRKLGNTAASVYNEMEAYFKEIESGNWLNISYHKQFEKMVKAICDWRDMRGKTAAEQKLCESLMTVYCEVYGADSLAKTHLLLDKEIKECEKEDENAKIYYNLMVQYERDREIAACDKKEYEGTDEEQKTEREKEKEQLRKAYDDYSKTMILDKTNVPLFPHRPCIEDIMQGGIGDCYLLASLAAVVKINPEAITSMLHDYGNIVKVSFDAKHVVYVSKKIFEGKSARNTLWVQIIEKAYGKAFKQKEQKIEDEQKDIKELVPYFMKQSEAKEFLENQVRKEADLLKKPEESEAFLKAQMGIDALLKRAYFSTHLWISGGRTQDALNNLYGFKNTKHLTQEYALSTRMIDTAKSYRKLCGSTAKNDDLNNEDAKLKIFIREHIQENLLQEMAYRLRDKNYKGYRAVTIEDFVDALKDIKNWKNQDNVNVFYRLLTEVKTEFPDVDESAIMKCLDQFGAELMEAGLEQDAEDKIVFGYRADLKSKTPNYTPKAKKWYALMEQACKNKLEVTAGSHRFGNIFNEFVKKNPTVNGIAQGHGFTVTNVYEQEGHYFVTLRNPWAQDLVEYRRKTNADGSVEITLGRIIGDTDISRGEFSLELNDFMNEFNQLTAINAEEKFEWEMKKTEEKEKKFKQKRKV